MAGGRIRTIKPELLEDERAAELSHAAFRLFIGCMLLADDYGNLRSSLGYLKAQVFWGQPADEAIERLIQELTEAHLVLPYDVNGQRYLSVQMRGKVDHPGVPQVPGPDGKPLEEGPEFTYFVRCGEDGPIKIGRSTNPARRLARLQTSNPEKLRFLHISRTVSEGDMHKRFAGLRLSGEWFSPSPELLRFICELAAGEGVVR